MIHASYPRPCQGKKSSLLKLPPSAGEEEVAIAGLSFHNAVDDLKEIIDAIGEKLENVKAKKTVVEFGVEIGVEAGQLTALIAKGSGKANLKITLEWS